jgi:K+/H+ antiporter YhaU regulatory subunit KhtT
MDTSVESFNRRIKDPSYLTSLLRGFKSREQIKKFLNEYNTTTEGETMGLSIEPDMKQQMIVRQNSLSHATQLVVQRTTETKEFDKIQAEIIRLAKRFEKYVYSGE